MFDFFCFVVEVYLPFCTQTHYLSQKFAITFTMLIYLVYNVFNILQDL